MNAPLERTGWLARLENHIVQDWLEGWSPAHIPSLSGMNAMVTGANSGIGYEVSRKLAENGAKLFMVCRDMTKGHEAAARIKQELGGKAELEVMQCELSSMENVLGLIDAYKRKGQPLHILINNAGVFFPGPFSLTKDGIEQTLAINFYAPALLTLGLLDVIPPGGRVIEMSSEGEGALGRFDPKNMRGDKYRDSGMRPYGTGKLYTIMLARELASRLQGSSTHVDVFAVQPGLVATPGHDKMDRRHYLSAWGVSTMGKLFGQRPYHGAWSTLFAATDPSLSGKGYAYIGPNRLGLWPATERQPGNLAARNPSSCWTVFQEGVKVLREVLGTRMPPVPRHPNAMEETLPERVAQAA